MTITPERLEERPTAEAEAVPGLHRPEPESYQQRLADLAGQPLARAGRAEGLIAGTAHSARDIWEYRQLLLLLVRRELKARYKDSVLGFVWSLLRPLALLGVYYVAIGKFLGAAKSTDDYAIFVYTGITVWNLFSEILSSSTGSIIANGGLVKKIYLPREVFPLSTIGSALFNFVIQLVILTSAAVIAGKPPGADLIYGLLGFLLILVFGTALAFLLSAVNVYLRDVQYLIEIMLMFGMWVSPVVYPYTKVAGATGQHAHEPLVILYQLNPVTLAVEAFQRAFWIGGHKYVQPMHLGVSIVAEIAVGLLVLWGCQRVFARLQDNFAQEI
jgi:ABC-2 type transport system permease protein